jgi:hypothetical protein
MGDIFKGATAAGQSREKGRKSKIEGLGRGPWDFVIMSSELSTRVGLVKESARATDLAAIPWIHAHAAEFLSAMLSKN